MNRRVLRVITRLNVGGPARHALLLSRELHLRWPTELLAGTPPSAEGELSDPRVAVQRTPLVRQISPAADAHAFRAVRRAIGRHDPAIVHTHMAKAGAVGRLAAATKRRPITVHTFHGHVLEGYFRPSVERMFLASERALAKRTDALVAVSEETRRDLLALGIGRAEQWHVIPLGLELHRHWQVTGHSGLLRGPLGLTDDALLVGFVGRLTDVKDPITLLRAFALVPDAHLVVVGDGALRANAEAAAHALGVQERVHFVGWQLDMPDVMADLDLIALSSLNEGTPLALIEAAACGVPAVATHVGGTGAVVRDGESGLLVPKGEPRLLGEAIAGLLGDESRRKAMGEVGRLVSRRFSAERLLLDISELYEGLLERRG